MWSWNYIVIENWSISYIWYNKPGHISHCMMKLLLTYFYWNVTILSILFTNSVTYFETNLNIHIQSDSLIRIFIYPDSYPGNEGVRIIEAPLYMLNAQQYHRDVHRTRLPGLGRSTQQLYHHFTFYRACLRWVLRYALVKTCPFKGYLCEKCLQGHCRR